MTRSSSISFCISYDSANGNLVKQQKKNIICDINSARTVSKDRELQTISVCLISGDSKKYNSAIE